MASMKQIKKRKKSIESTGKITKAMKLVATVKLQKTKQIMFNKIQQYKADHPHESIPHMKMEIETRKELIKEIGSLSSYLKKDGVIKSFEDCNCKLRITNNNVDWESRLL